MNKLEVGTSVHLSIAAFTQAEQADHPPLRTHGHQQRINSLKRRRHQIAREASRPLSLSIESLMQKERTLRRCHAPHQGMLCFNQINIAAAEELRKVRQLPEQLPAHHPLGAIRLKRGREVKVSRALIQHVQTDLLRLKRLHDRHQQEFGGFIEIERLAGKRLRALHMQTIVAKFREEETLACLARQPPCQRSQQGHDHRYQDCMRQPEIERLEGLPETHLLKGQSTQRYHQVGDDREADSAYCPGNRSPDIEIKDQNLVA